MATLVLCLLGLLLGRRREITAREWWEYTGSEDVGTEAAAGWFVACFPVLVGLVLLFGGLEGAGVELPDVRWFPGFFGGLALLGPAVNLAHSHLASSPGPPSLLMDIVIVVLAGAVAGLLVIALPAMVNS